MAEVSRTLQSLKNIGAIWIGQVVSILCTFAVRMVFVRYLSQDYLGLETLFSNVLSILALAELGVASAIVFSLYEPLAKDDHEAVKSIMRLFRRAYTVIGIVIAIAGCALAPHIEMFIGEAPDIPYLHAYFLFFVANSSVSYFFSYKASLITADQKNYVVSLIRYGFQVLLCIAQMLVLVFTQNYFLFLTCMLVATLGQNICFSAVANKMYPYIREKDIQPIDPDVLGTIKRNVSGMIIHKTSSVVNAPVNGVVLSAFSNLATLAIYGNYLLVMNTLGKIVDQMFDAIVSSVGNLNVTESKDRQYEVFRTSFFVNAMIVGALTACYLPLVSPFIEFAFGPEYLFPFDIVILYAIWFYFRGIRDAALSFVSAYGLYWQTKWKALAETIFLLCTTIPLTYFFGIRGLLVANIIVQVCVSLLFEGLIMHKHGLMRGAGKYFASAAVYSFFALVLCIVCTFIVSLIPGSPVIRFLLGGVVCVIIGFGGYFLAFHRTRECHEVVGIARSLFGRLFKKNG